jgi:outer membrane immunogenic protein
MIRNNWGLFLAGAPLAFALAAPAAFGADLPVKALPVKAPVVAPFSWTGWYMGVNAGYGLGSGYGQIAAPTASAMPVGFSSASQTSLFSSSSGATAFNAVPSGGLGGGQLGYNYQLFGSFVVGAETDIQGADISDNRTAFGGALINHKLDWFGTTRARVGLASGPVLSYVTGGVAYGDVETGLTTPTGGVTTSTTKTGWTWGSGVEAALGGNWTAKAEYLYVDLGSTGAASSTAGSLTVKNQEQIFRGGLNYRFGPPASPASFAPAYNWGGVFLGGTVGYGLGHNDSTYTEPAPPFGMIFQPGVTASAFDLSPRGFNGGGILGYNWQFGSWVAGVEGDFQGSMGTGYLTSLADGTAIDQKLSWFGTARARVGYSVGQALVYGTGGAAVGEVKESIAQGAASASYSHTKSGFAVGGGIENKLDLFGLLGPNWTTRTEYLFVDLGSVTDTFVPAAAAFGAPAQTLNSTINEHIWRTVVTYKF